MKLAVDVNLGRKGIRILREAGHEVVVEAQAAESDESWFARAVAAGAEAVLSHDSDLDVLCHGHGGVAFIRMKYGSTGASNAARALARIQRSRERSVARDFQRSRPPP